MKKKNKSEMSAKIKEIKQLIISSTDAKHRADLVEQLITLQKSVLHEPVELEVLCKDVKEEIDFGANKILRTKRGFLFVAKGGMYTFIESKMIGLCAMFEMLFEYKEKNKRGEVDDDLYNNIAAAIQYVMQAPLFASMDSTTLFTIARQLLETYNDYVKNNINEAEVEEETEADMKANNDMDIAATAVEQLINAPIPPVEE